MRLDVLTREQCEQVRLWRNQCLETLRTPFPLTAEQQEAFYRDVICNPQSPHRYWVIWTTREDVDAAAEIPGSAFVGMGGLTNIQWENRIAEISLILNPAFREKGLGEKAVALLLAEGFDRLGLKTICGECYRCNEAGCKFWSRIADRYEGVTTGLPNRKFWAGRFWNSLYFSIDADDYRRVRDETA